MADNKCFCGTASSAPRETVCIDTQRILDSCRDRDCYEDLRVFLTDYGQDVIERTSSIRVQRAEIHSCNVCIEPVDFSRGFYRVSVRYYIRLECQACVARGCTQDFDGIVVCDKNVVLFRSEGSVHVFRSGSDCCTEDGAVSGDNTPTAVVEAVDPVVLTCRVAEPSVPCRCCCACAELPECVQRTVSGALYPGRDRKQLLVSIGIFSVIRIERPAQLLVNAASCAVPEKECRPAEDHTDPCCVFRNMEFPVGEFNPPSLSCMERR